MKKTAVPRRLAAEVADGLTEVRRWAAGEPSGVAVYQPPAADAPEPTPGGGPLADLRRAVGRAVRARRAAAKLSRAELAGRIGERPARVAAVESAAPGASLDLAFRALFAAGGDLADVRLGKGRGGLTPPRPG